MDCSALTMLYCPLEIITDPMTLLVVVGCIILAFLLLVAWLRR